MKQSFRSSPVSPSLVIEDDDDDDEDDGDDGDDGDDDDDDDPSPAVEAVVRKFPCVSPPPSCNRR